MRFNSKRFPVTAQQNSLIWFVQSVQVFLLKQLDLSGKRLAARICLVQTRFGSGKSEKPTWSQRNVPDPPSQISYFKPRNRLTLKNFNFRIGRKHWGVLCLQINQCSAEFHQNTSSLQDKECLEITVKHYTWYRQKYSQPKIMKKPNFLNLRSTNLKNPLLKYTIKLLKSNHPSSFPLQFIDCPVLAHTFRRLLWCDGARSAFKFRCCQS